MEIIHSNTSVKEFYDGLYHSLIYTAHHRCTQNIGYTCNKPTQTNLNTNDEKIEFSFAKNDTFQLQLYKKLLQCLPYQDKSEQPYTIVDIGCGSGGGLCQIHEIIPNINLIGLDISEGAIYRSKEIWQKYLQYLQVKELKVQIPNLRLYQESCEHMSQIASNSVNVIIAVQSLLEVQYITDTIMEFQRILKPGGYLCIADFIPSEQNDKIQLEILDLLQRDQYAITKPGLPFKCLVNENITSNVIEAMKLNTVNIKKIIKDCIPPDFRDHMENVFAVDQTNISKQLQEGTLGYRLLCLEYTGDNTIEGNSTSKHELLKSENEDEEDILDYDLPNYYHYKAIFPQLEVLKSNYEMILNEMNSVHQNSKLMEWPSWPEDHYGGELTEWRVFPLCFTFPAYDASKTVWVPGTCSLCPKTTALLRKLPGIRTALFSKLGPTTRIGAHRGWADLSNDILRCHLGLVVPNGFHCAMVVGGETKYHEAGELLVFDDSKLHFAYNQHPTATRIVLIVDLYRPDELPRGRAIGEHTDELDTFIEEFGNIKF